MDSLLKQFKVNKTFSKTIISFAIVVIGAGVLHLLLILNSGRMTLAMMSILSVTITLLLLLSSMIVLTVLFKYFNLPIRSLSQSLEQVKKGDYHRKVNTEEVKHYPTEIEDSLVEVSKLLVRAKKEKDRLRQLAYIDPVTGISNRHAFKEHYDEIWDETIVGGEPISILFIDIDDFKELNDLYGHHVGDLFLRKIGQLIKNVAKAFGHIVYRYGGDEFIVIANKADYDKALLFAERVHQEVKKMNGTSVLMSYTLTVSIGIADIIPSEHETDRGAIIRQADRALYEAKHRGGNNVRAKTNESILS